MRNKKSENSNTIGINSDFLKIIEDINTKNAKTNCFIEDRLFSCADKSSHALLKALKIPYLFMDIPPLDYKTMLREAKKLESASVPHRSDDSEGWNSLCLHGIEAKKTLSSDKYGYLTEEETPFKWTWASKKAPVTTNYLKKLIALGYYSSVYRIRFMYLKPGGFIKFHQDREEERKSMGPLNIALNMPHHCYWLFEEWGSVPFREGTGFAVDISNRHGLWNFSNETRIHIIIHGVYGDEYYKTIKRSVDIGIRKALVHKRKPPPLSEESISPNKKKSMSSDLEPAFLLWLKNHEVEDPELFRITSNITRHFYMLRRKRKNTVFYSHTSLNYLLSKSYEDGKPWAVVMVPGNVLKEGFYEAVKNLISRADSDVFMFAHIIDRKERWFGLHHQCFIVNLSLWDQIGRPPFIKKATGAIPVPKVIRSLENIHDDYTPVYLKPGYQTTTQHPRVTGWHWIQKILEAGLRIENFPQEIREKKLFLYPEQNQETLLRALKSDSLKRNTDNQMTTQLSHHQKKVLEYLAIESKGFRKKMFVFNNEAVRANYMEGKLEAIDAFIGLPSGFMDCHTLYRHGFEDKTQLIYFDVNQNILNFKKKLLELWDGKNYPDFLNKAFNKYKNCFENDVIIANSQRKREETWEKELKIWGGQESFCDLFTKIKALKRDFINLNLIDDFSPLIKIIEEMRNKHIVLWYSNCFNYTPGLAYAGWRHESVKEQGVFFLNNLLRLSKKNNLQITVYGEDVIKCFKLSTFGEKIENVFN